MSCDCSLSMVTVLTVSTVQEEALYYWATADTAARATARKTSWKMSNGACAAEEAREKAGARYTEAEWQQMVLGLRREHKEKLETLRKEQDEALFKVGDNVQLCKYLLSYHIYSLFPISFTSSFQIVQRLVVLRVSVSWTKTDSLKSST